MVQSSYKSLANIPVRIANYWRRLNEAYYECFTLEKRVQLFTILTTITIGVLVFNWLSIPFTGRVDITMLMPLLLISVLFIFNPDLLLVLLIILYDTLISTLASRLITVSAFATLSVPYLLIIVSATYFITRTFCFTSANRSLLASPISKGLIIMLVTTVGIGLAYHVKIGKQTPGSMAVMTAWLCYFILITGVTSKLRFRAFARALLVVSILVAAATIAQSYLGVDHFLFLKFTARDTRIEQLDGITRVIPQGYLLIYIMMHFSWHMFLTTESLLKRWGWGMALCLFITAMIVTMFRNMWLIGGCIMLLQYLMVNTRQRIRSISYLAALSLILICALSVTTSSSGNFNPFMAVSKRISEASEESINDRKSSVGDRVDEIRLIRDMWIKSPLIGIGWGKGFETQSQWEPLFNTYKIYDRLYIHNTPWWFLGKSGVLGLCGLFIFWIMSMRRIWFLAKTADNEYSRYFITGLGMAFASICISSMFHPYFSAAPDLILPITLLLGMVELQNHLTQGNGKQDVQTNS